MLKRAGRAVIAFVLAAVAAFLATPALSVARNLANRSSDWADLVGLMMMVCIGVGYLVLMVFLIAWVVFESDYERWRKQRM
jgi:hypothetical protein